MVDGSRWKDGFSPLNGSGVTGAVGSCSPYSPRW